MQSFQAKYLFNGLHILENKRVVYNENRILSIESFHTIDSNERYVEGIVAPGFVNVHCHTELSHLINVLPEKKGLVPFLKQVITQRNAKDKNEIKQAICQAFIDMQKTGIVAVGDICNTIDSIECKKGTSLYTHSFIEHIGFNSSRVAEIVSNNNELKNAFCNANLTASTALHAPYSVSLPLLNSCIEKNEIISFHNQESPQENLFFENGKSEMNSLYDFLNMDILFHTVRAKSSLQCWFPHLIKHTNHKILVHNTFTSQHDFEYIRQLQNVFLCTCPNANLYIENTLPDYETWIQNDAQICIGTDSLASNYSLSILDEIKTIMKHFPSIPQYILLQWATYNGAKALKINDKFGEICVGKNPYFIHISELENGKINENSQVHVL